MPNKAPSHMMMNLNEKNGQILQHYVKCFNPFSFFYGNALKSEISECVNVSSQCFPMFHGKLKHSNKDFSMLFMKARFTRHKHSNTCFIVIVWIRNIPLPTPKLSL
ncbi:CLUMA_CG006868, isoform A [Clunio marinus]|uniref:CLUMA_CG006868, isoform A n=1 Tax=Clunio marinus TaxID=568069 RepID=A0A1J1HZ01_9DIPT|nr:CLUMA_CG006868, isoform A [Clunio marinus]